MTPSNLTNDWNPEAYERFRGLRLQPALDLLSAVGDLPTGPVIDLGCGNGPVGGALKQRFAARVLIGVDNSPAMLAKAANTGEYTSLQEADIADWQPDSPPALIYSNAALQWLGAHEGLMPKLVGLLADGGVLAVQMPHQNRGPSHQGWIDAFDGLFRDRKVGRGPDILTPSAYFDILSSLGEFRVWETEYLQHLPPSDKGHPVRLFTESTFARPYLEATDNAERAELIAAYEAAMGLAYPLRPDGSVLFAFKRLFFTLRRT